MMLSVIFSHFEKWPGSHNGSSTLFIYQAFCEGKGVKLTLASKEKKKKATKFLQVIWKIFAFCEIDPFQAGGWGHGD